MDKRRQGYEAFIAQLKKQWEETEEFQGERLNRMIAKVQAYLEAAGDLTQDELALIAEYVKRDLGNYDESRAEVPESAFMLALKDTVWTSGCKSWYQTADGINFAIWPKSTWRYWLETRSVNEADYVFGKCTGPLLSAVGGGASTASLNLAGEQAMARTSLR